MTSTSKNARKGNAAKASQADIIARIEANGFRYGQASGTALAAASELRADIAKLAKKSAEAAQALFHQVYIAGRLNPEAEGLTAAMRKAADVILKERAGYKENDKGIALKHDDKGKLRRTLDEHRLYGGARTAWTRFSKEEDVKRTDKRGGNRHAPKAKQAKGNGNTPEPKRAGEVTLQLVAKTPKDVASNVHKLREGWVNLLAGSKDVALPEACLSLGNDITAMLNKFEKLVAESK